MTDTQPFENPNVAMLSPRRRPHLFGRTQHWQTLDVEPPVPFARAGEVIACADEASSLVRHRLGCDTHSREGNMEAIIGIVFMLVVWGIVLAGSIYFNNNVQ
jgi:hypothetical protein